MISERDIMKPFFVLYTRKNDMKVSSTLKEVNALEEDYKTKSREIFVQNCSKILILRTDFWKHKASL